MTHPPKAYTGDLAAPIEPSTVPISLFDDPAEREANVAAEQQRVAAELARRYQLLMEHHGVPADRGLLSMAMLAIELARTHVPGLQVAPAAKPGRPKRWDQDANLLLVADFVELMAGGKTRAEAALTLSKSQRYRDFKDKADTLAKRFDEAKKERLVESLVKLTENLPAEHFITFARMNTEN